MSNVSRKISALDTVWEHRLRQRIALEKIVLQAGNPKDRLKAKKFLDSMAKANPQLLENIEQYMLDLIYGPCEQDLELFDVKDYSKAGGLKRAIKLPKDIAWEKRMIKRTVQDYMDLFHPCENKFHDAMIGLQYAQKLHPGLFAEAKNEALEIRNQILACDFECPCHSIEPEESQLAESFAISGTGRFKVISSRIRLAQNLKNANMDNHMDWSFFLDRINEIAPEMLI
jgi:hypothetical protein